MRWVDSNYKWILVGILLLALGLRLWNIDYRLPYVYNPDESVAVERAVGAFWGNFNPHFYDWGSLTFYIHAAAYVPFYLVGKMDGDFKKRTDIPAPDKLMTGTAMAPLPSLWLYSRIVNVIFGVGSVLLIFLVGRLLINNAAGLLAALLLAVSDTNVIHSHFITTDTFLVFFVLLSFLGSSFVFTNGKMWHYVLAGAASGLAAAVKYPGGLVIISLLTAHFLRYGQRGFAEKKVYIGILCSAVAFVIAMPYSVLDFHSFFQDGILGDITHYTVGHAGAEFNTLYFYWTRFHFFEGPVYIFAVLGLILGLAKFRKQTLLLLSCGLPYFILISSLKVRFARTLMPVLVFVFLLASMFVVFFLPRLFKDKVLRRCVIGIVILLMVAIPLPRTIYEVKKLAIVDSRDTARIWINENLPAKSKIVIENYSPFIDAKKFSLVRVPTLSRNPPELFKDVDYLVFSEGVYRRYVDDRENYPDLAEGYSALWNSMSLVKNFTDGNFTVMIYTPR